ncbi:MAG: hypothetical protein GX045_03095 [Clostridiaceae bacterium]|nr:hypothetical protein [Clostridiaceae bacterium]
MKRKWIEPLIYFFIVTALGISNMLVINKPTVSDVENRALQKKPEFSVSALFNGNYIMDFENYYNDTFFLRDKMILLSRDIRDALTINPGAKLIVTEGEGLAKPNPQDDRPDNEKHEPTAIPSGNDPGIEPTSKQDDLPGIEPGQEQEPTPTQVPVETTKPNNFELEDAGHMGYWLIIDGKAVELFRFQKDSIDYYTETLNMYREAIGKDIKLYSMIAPTAGEFAILRRYKDLTDSQNEALQYINHNINPDIFSVDLFEALNPHRDEYIYFRTDHHWTALGAYYAYCEFMNVRGEEPIPLERYETVEIQNFLGSAYTKTLDKSLEANPDTITVYLPFVDYEYTMYNGATPSRREVIDLSFAGKKDKYNVFISSGGGTWSVIKTEVKNGKKLLVIKDSFGNAIIPFFLPHYEEIYVIDARFYNSAFTKMGVPQFVNHYGIQEVAIINYMEDVNWPEFMQKVRNLLNRVE